MKNIVPCVLIAIFLSGCGLFFREPYNKVNYYDLSYPKEKQSIGDLRLSVSGIKADKPYSDKMVFRVSENRIEMDEFNRWSCNPSDLVGKYFTLAFENSSKDGSKSYNLSAEILRMEADLKSSSVILILQVSVQSPENGNAGIQWRCRLKNTYSQTISVEKVTGENFAKGVEAAMVKICAELSQDIQKIKE